MVNLAYHARKSAMTLPTEMVSILTISRHSVVDNNLHAESINESSYPKCRVKTIVIKTITGSHGAVSLNYPNGLRERERERKRERAIHAATAR